MKRILTAYTDGSCIPNPGRGGWAFVALGKRHILYDSGGKDRTTNNEMELTAVVECIKFFKDFSIFKIYTDSQYVIKCATGEWKRKKNLILWKEYDNVVNNKEIYWNWVKGHSGDYYNELVDQLAKEQTKK